MRHQRSSTHCRVAVLMASMLSLGPTLSIALVADAAQRGAPPANSDPESPPLHTAVRAGDARLVKSLIKRGADVRVRNRLGVAPLTIAAMRGDAAMLDILLDAGADPNMSFGAGESALMTAARVGIPEAVRVLIERGADVNATEGWLEETALMWAAAENHAEAMTALIEAGALVDARSAKTDFPEQKFDIEGMLTTYLPQGRWTPLMYAARQNAIDAARVLAKAGADLDAPDPDGTTALMIAIINAHFDLAAVLLEQGGSPNIADRTGMTALYAAVDMHTLDRTFGRPQPRFESAIDGVRLVKSLLERGADPNLPLWEPTIQRHHNAGNPFMGAGATPLVRAAKNGDIELVKMLLEHGADINVVLADGTNLVMAAATSGAGQFSRSGKDEAGVADVIRLGLGLGLDVDAVDQRGRTALHMAAGNGDDKVVRLLAERGAKLDVVDERGFTPLDLASGKGGRPSPRNMPKESTVALLQELMKSQRR